MAENNELSEAVSFVVDQINSGLTPDEVRATLLEQGSFSNNDIDLIFDNIEIYPPNTMSKEVGALNQVQGRPLPPIVRKLITIGVIGFIMVFLTLLVHEGGHVLFGSIVGAPLYKIILLGVQVYPAIEFIGFNGYLGQVWFDYSTITQQQDALMKMMGSGSTLVVSTISLILLYLIRPQNFILKTVLIYASLLYLDIVTYTLGLRFSGEKEPLEAARMFGLSDTTWYIYTFLIFAAFTGLLLYYFMSSKTNKENVTNPQAQE